MKYLTSIPAFLLLDLVSMDVSANDKAGCTSSGGLTLKILGPGGPIADDGPIPTLVYRIRIGQKSIVISGEQNGAFDGFVVSANGTDVLLMPMPVPEGITRTGRKLHAPPSIIGKIVAQTDAKKLVLSHFMAHNLQNLEENLKEIRSQ